MNHAARQVLANVRESWQGAYSILRAGERVALFYSLLGSGGRGRVHTHAIKNKKEDSARNIRCDLFGIKTRQGLLCRHNRPVVKDLAAILDVGKFVGQPLCHIPCACISQEYARARACHQDTP